MPFYSFKCPFDGRRETVQRIAERRNDELLCPECMAVMKRDFADESPTSTFHMTRDLYAQKKVWDAKRKKNPSPMK